MGSNRRVYEWAPGPRCLDARRNQQLADRLGEKGRPFLSAHQGSGDTYASTNQTLGGTGRRLPCEFLLHGMLNFG